MYVHKEYTKEISIGVHCMCQRRFKKSLLIAFGSSELLK